MTASHDSEKKGLLPFPLWLALGAVFGVGAILLATRTALTERLVYSGIADCDASVLAEKDGTEDEYGIVKFRQNSPRVVQLMSLCDTDPDSALKLVRKALASGNKSAKLVAIHALFFLAQRHVLETADFDSLVSRMNPNSEADEEVRKAAQRQISNLLLLRNLAAKDAYENLPAGLPAPEKDAPSHKIMTRAEGPDGQKVLRLRWSDNAVACAWWAAQAGKGAWNKDEGAFIVP
jgi:hypothetical protein